MGIDRNRANLIRVTRLVEKKGECGDIDGALALAKGELMELCIQRGGNMVREAKAIIDYLASKKNRMIN